MKPVECKEFPGYFEIPGFSNYCVDEKSNILIKSKNKVIKQYPVYGSTSSDEKYGTYLRATMYSDDKKLVARAVHRLMGEIFKHPGEDVDLTTLQVNHLNGVKSDNFPDNLEWTTCKANIEHAKDLYVGRKHIPMEIRYVHGDRKGEVLRFKNIAECGKHLGLHRTTIINRLFRYGEVFVFPEGCQMRLGNTDREWIEPSTDLEDIETFKSKPLLVKNMLTGEISEFQDAKSVKGILPYSPSFISTLSDDLTQPCVWGNDAQVYIVIKKYPEKEFRNVEDPYEDIACRECNHERIVVAKNTETGETRIYRKCQDCAYDFGILKTTLRWRLKKKEPSSYNNWIFRYYREFKALTSGN